MNSRIDLTTFTKAAARVGAVVFLGVVPAALVAVFTLAPTEPSFDFRAFWQAGRDVIEGVSPYPAADEIEAGSVAVQEFVYPPPVALLMVPFGLVGFEVAAAVFTLLLVAATTLTLRYLGVQDWRCYGAVFSSILVLGALRLGALTPLLALGLAVAWRFRERRLVVATVLASLVVAKLFLWPILVWAAFTGRRSATSIAIGIGALSTLVAWAVLAFEGIAEYPELLRRVADAQFEKSYSAAALAASVGLPDRLALSVPIVLAPVGVAAIAFSSRRPNGDAAAFVTAIAAALLLSPLVWLHYFALLVVLIALTHSQLAWAWFLPLGYWIVPFQETGAETWRIAVGLGLAFVTWVVCVRREATEQTSMTRRSSVAAVGRGP
jgi:hypothetical protein